MFRNVSILCLSLKMSLKSVIILDLYFTVFNYTSEPKTL